MEKSLDELGT